MSGTPFRFQARSSVPASTTPDTKVLPYQGLIVSVPHFCCYRFVATDSPALTRGNYPYGGVLTMATASTPAPVQAPEPKSKPEQVAPRASAYAPADAAPRPRREFRKYLTPALV